MRTRRSDSRLLRRAVVSLLALPLVLVGCSSTGDDAAPTPAPGSPTTAGLPVRAAPDVVRSLTRALATRAEAIRTGDRDTFLAALDDTDPDFVRAQDTYLANLGRLPIGEFGYRLERTSMVRVGTDYWADVEVTLELDGYDDVPVVSLDRYLFTHQPTGRYALASVTDQAWEERHDIDPQPWETGPITVRTGTGVLGLFDPGSTAHADRIVADVEAGIAAVSAAVPYAWERRVVVYALSDPRFLTDLDHLPGDDPLRLDGVTFPVPARPGGERLADTRFLLNPRMLAAGGVSRDRLIRHELTHVALGDRADGVPTWFSEGLAEYVSVRPLAPQDRAVSRVALQAADEGVTEMPADHTFNGTTFEANYAIAWWACEYVAETYDESLLWILLDSLKGAEDPDDVLSGILQLDADDLAHKGARLMLRTYRPEPSEGPDDGSGSPSASPTS